MKSVPVKSIAVIDLTPFRGDEEYGVSSYRDVLIVWDEDHDGRIFAFIDEALKHVDKPHKLLAANESEGELTLVWEYYIPEFFGGDGKDFASSGITMESPVDGDMWNIHNYIN